MTEDPNQHNILCETQNVSKLYTARSGLRSQSGKQRFVRAVDDVSIKIQKGDSLGLVGESGCGKSTLGRLLLRLETPSQGKIIFDNTDITRLRGRKMRKMRKQMQMIFQDPASSLNPRYTVYSTLTEAIKVHQGRMSKAKLNGHLETLLNMVGLPLSCLEKFPKEFSGGEKQRIAIARALAVEPRFIVADEPISSLDMTSQSQIRELLANLRRELNVAFLLITHNTELVRHLCKKVAVMYLGQIIEYLDTQTLFDSPAHPYTKALMAATLSKDPSKQKKISVLPGDPPSPLDPPRGCHFHPRCPVAKMECQLLKPKDIIFSNGQMVKCHFDLRNKPQKN